MAPERERNNVTGGRSPNMQASVLPFPLANDDDTLTEGAGCFEHSAISIDDWSQTGRGSHVEFGDDENVPLEQGRFLGRGAFGDVHEVAVQGHKLALKKMIIKRKLAGKEKREIEILKKLPSHEHIVQLVGTYTQSPYLGLLLYPVAVCDLRTFFDDVEAWYATGIDLSSLDTRKGKLDTAQKTRLDAIGYDFPLSTESNYASPVYYSLGCLIAALSYLHNNQIRHKDLKPSNILLSKNRIWLADFGCATDFSELSQSATDNERGTPRYFSPEMAEFKPCGRASDMFSLACVLLEIVVLHDHGTLQRLQDNRSADPAFHANLNRVDSWLDDSLPKASPSRRAYLILEIKAMLAHGPRMRPTAEELLVRVTGYDLAHMITSKDSLFGDCCREHLISSKHLERSMIGFNRMRSDLQRAHEELTGREQQMARVTQEYAATSAHLVSEQRISRRLASRVEELNRHVLEIHKTYPENGDEKSGSSVDQRQRHNTSGTKTSDLELLKLQLEKRRLEQRIVEKLEARDVPSIPPSSPSPATQGSHGISFRPSRTREPPSTSPLPSRERESRSTSPRTSRTREPRTTTPTGRLHRKSAPTPQTQASHDTSAQFPPPKQASRSIYRSPLPTRETHGTSAPPPLSEGSHGTSSPSPALVVLPQRTSKPRKKSASAPIFKWAPPRSNPRKKSNDLVHGEMKEEKRENSSRDDTEERRNTPAMRSSHQYGSLTGMPPAFSIDPFHIVERERDRRKEKRAREKAREREQRGKGDSAYKNKASEDSHLI